MTTAWTKGIALGLLLGPLACDVSVGDPPIDGFGGDGGSAGSAGDGGSAGAGDAGSAGSGDAGSAGNAGAGGSGGSDSLPPPTCDEEVGDEDDPCVQCLKQSCCDEWLACDDETCVDEWTGVAECAQEVNMEGFLDQETYGMCISDNTAAMFPAMNTNDLLLCINEPVTAPDAGLPETRCAVECFGSDVLFE
jgi:hypothetical protein